MFGHMVDSLSTTRAPTLHLLTESGTSESNVATVTLDREGVTNGHGEEIGDGQVVNAVQIDGQNCNAETEVSDGLVWHSNSKLQPGFSNSKWGLAHTQQTNSAFSLPGASPSSLLLIFSIL